MKKSCIKEPAPAEALIICVMISEDLRPLCPEPSNDAEAEALEDDRLDHTMKINLNIAEEAQ